MALSLRASRNFKPQLIGAVRSKSGSIPLALQRISSNVFNEQHQLRVLGTDLYGKLKEASQTGKPLNKEDADKVASGIQAWAMERGAVHFVHWFSPIRGENAEKHDSFIDLNFKNGDLKVDFSGSKLFQGETDGSSFPNGALRATHSAAAYTGWDTSSPPFIKGDSLFIPSSFVAWTGESLDEKTPLLRSNSVINENGIRLLRALGDNNSQRVVSNVGWEQEFYVIDLEDFQRRPDIQITGRTLIGAPPPRGQQTSVNYFGSVPLRVKQFFKDAQAELWSLGISLATFHNEVAPAQHETAPIFSLTNVAADQNALAMKVLSEHGFRHGLAILFHEKPFKGLNGNGKHNNWGLNTNTGQNLFVPGKTPLAQRIFIAFTAALIRGLNLHGDAIRAGVSGAANDHRLGAQEAPPAIISCYLGQNLTNHLEKIIAGGPLEGYSSNQGIIRIGANSVMEIKRPLEDRNRTAPFPFCGNRWECRAVGGSQNINFPLAVINTVMAESLGFLAKRIESMNGNVRDAVALTLKENMRVVFNGNGYSEEWLAEAERRGLHNLRNTPAALEAFGAKKNIDLFSSTKVFSEKEFLARKSIMYQAYNNQVQMEAATLLDMIRTGVIPAIVRDLENTSTPAHGGIYTKTFDKKKRLLQNLVDGVEKLEELQDGYHSGGHGESSEESEKRDANHSLKVLEQMEEVRKHSDAAELLVEAKLWPFPKYSEILYRHHNEGEFIK